MTVWLIARAAGLAALVLLSVSTAIGALMTARVPARATHRVVLQYVHRVAASLGLAVLGLHLVTILADSYAHVGVKGAVIPFASQYRATWVGLGVIAGYTFVAAAFTGFLRGRMARSARAAAIWRALHGAAYAGWAMAMLHGLRSGTDTSVSWVRWLYAACFAGVLAAVATRVLTGSAKTIKATVPPVRPARTEHLAVTR